VTDDELEHADNAARARMRAEEARSREIVEAAKLAEAVDLIEEAIPQVSPQTLPALQERLDRAAARARARLEALR